VGNVLQRYRLVLPDTQRQAHERERERTVRRKRRLWLSADRAARWSLMNHPASRGGMAVLRGRIAASKPAGSNKSHHFVCCEPCQTVRTLVWHAGCVDFFRPTRRPLHVRGGPLTREREEENAMRSTLWLATAVVLGVAVGCDNQITRSDIDEQRQEVAEQQERVDELRQQEMQEDNQVARDNTLRDDTMRDDVVSDDTQADLRG